MDFQSPGQDADAALGTVPGPDSTPCACGCGRPVLRSRSHAIYASDACKRRHFVPKDQRALSFDPPAAPVVKANPSVAPQARERLQRKAQAVLDRLRQGSVDNLELPRIGGARYGARLGEIREHLRWLHGRGKDWDPIECVENKATGYALYTLVED